MKVGPKLFPVDISCRSSRPETVPSSSWRTRFRLLCSQSSETHNNINTQFYYIICTSSFIFLLLHHVIFSRNAHVQRSSIFMYPIHFITQSHWDIGQNVCSPEWRFWRNVLLVYCLPSSCTLARSLVAWGHLLMATSGPCFFYPDVFRRNLQWRQRLAAFSQWMQRAFTYTTNIFPYLLSVLSIAFIQVRWNGSESSPYNIIQTLWNTKSSNHLTRREERQWFIRWPLCVHDVSHISPDCRVWPAVPGARVSPWRQCCGNIPCLVSNQSH